MTFRYRCGHESTEDRMLCPVCHDGWQVEADKK